MVGTIGSNSMNIPQQMSQSSSSNSSLSTSQLETISSVLEEYDANNLSSEDAQSIVAAFKDAGIESSKAFENTMTTEGFDAKTVGDTAGIGGPKGGGGGMPPPPPPPSEEEESSVTDLLDTLLTLGEDDEDDESSTTSSFNEVMEYTSRILSLNESSKTSVMEMLENYSSNENDYSEEEISNIVKNSLGSILSDPDNYNHISFYA